jgi:acyl carrier protein
METRNEILDCIIQKLASILGCDAAGLNQNTAFADLNMKSVNYSQLTTALEDACDVEVPYMDFKRNATLGAAADYVLRLASE